MVFSDAAPKDADTLYLEMYYPTRFWAQMTDEALYFTKRILALKDNDVGALAYFYDMVAPLLASDFTVTVVPPHTANLNPRASAHRSVALLAARLAAAQGKNRLDGTACLVRHTSVGELKYGGCRDVNIHINSIRVENTELVQGKDVLLLDDVMTTGNSRDACERLLKNTGARCVKSIVMAKTATSIPPELRRVYPPVYPRGDRY